MLKTIREIQASVKKAWENGYPLIMNEIMIRKENVGVIETRSDGDKTRKSNFVITVSIIPDAESVKQKIDWVYSHFDYLKDMIWEFISNYIKTYFQDPLTDLIVINNMELLINDLATSRSLNKIALSVDVVELEHGDVKQKDNKEHGIFRVDD